MDFDQYQTRVLQMSEAVDRAHELVPMLGVGAHVGKLLQTQQRYLREQLVAETNKSIVRRELGLVLRWCVHVADLNAFTLNTAAVSNIHKVDRRARRQEREGVKPLPAPRIVLRLDEYQGLAAQTDQDITVGVDPLSLSVPMLGLAGEAGNLLVEMKKKFRGDSRIEDWPGFVEEEIGDLLWYVATVTGHSNLTLQDIAEADLQRLALSAPKGTPGVHPHPHSFDSTYLPTEQFPRQLHLQFQEQTLEGEPVVTMTLLHAVPNAFPDGPIAGLNPAKPQGFSVGKRLGDQVTDNSRRSDAYRYHDAIHLGFLAVLGWSPNLRGLLRLKRKSNQQTDDAEDGARAVFAEEGLAAILAKQATECRNFETPKLVPEDTLDLITTVVEDLEVAKLPHWLWREAISQGFTVLGQLAEGGGGYVLADLDTLTLQYSKFPFPRP